jgi:hypothetical protein
MSALLILYTFENPLLNAEAHLTPEVKNPISPKLSPFSKVLMMVFRFE